MAPVLLAAGHGTDATSGVLLALALILIGAKLAGGLFERVRQPSVLGDLERSPCTRASSR